LNAIKTLLGLALLAIFGVFLFQNTQVIDVQFLMFEFTMSRVVLILMVFIIGFACGSIGLRVRQHRQARRKSEKQELKAAQEQLHNQQS
jgi:uncharacterized integral membrane protein